MNFTNAKDVISYLYSLPKLHPKGDLSYVKRALDVLDNPQNKVKTIHVTGTNGKGSTSYYISNLLRKAGSFYLVSEILNMGEANASSGY